MLCLLEINRSFMQEWSLVPQQYSTGTVEQGQSGMYLREAVSLKPSQTVWTLPAAVPVGRKERFHSRMPFPKCCTATAATLALLTSNFGLLAK